MTSTTSMIWFLAAVVTRAFAVESFNYHAPHATYVATPYPGLGSDVTARLYEQCQMKDPSGTMIGQRQTCVTKLLALLMAQTRVAPNGFAVSSAKSGLTNVTVSLHSTYSKEDFHLYSLPTGSQFFDFTGDRELAGVKVETAQSNATASVYADYLDDLKGFVSNFTGGDGTGDVPFRACDKWSFHVCGSSGQLLWHGRIVAQERDFNVTDFEELPPPSCGETVGLQGPNREDGADSAVPPPHDALHQYGMNASVASPPTQPCSYRTQSMGAE